ESSLSGVSAAVHLAGSGGSFNNATSSPGFSFYGPLGAYDLTFSAPTGYRFADQSGLGWIDSAGTSLHTDSHRGYSSWSIPLYSPDVTGHLFNDANGNGVLDSGESGLASISIGLQVEGSSTSWTSTDSSGNFSFSVPTGPYHLVSAAPAGYVFTASAGV